MSGLDLQDANMLVSYIVDKGASKNLNPHHSLHDNSLQGTRPGCADHIGHHAGECELAYLALASLVKSSSALASVSVSDSWLVWEGLERRRLGMVLGGACDEGLAASSVTSNKFLYRISHCIINVCIVQIRKC